MEGDTAGPGRSFQQMKDDTVYTAYVLPITEAV